VLIPSLQCEVIPEYSIVTSLMRCISPTAGN
jgi:hypothetical protein